MMTHLRWAARPNLTEPVMVAAFEGWNDAGEAATLAVRHLRDRWGLRRCAEIDPEEFFDFTAQRPQVRLDEAGDRQLRWPRNWVYAGTGGDGVDVVVLLGTEPGLRWRTFTTEIVDAARDLGARMLVTFGALLADVPHRSPVPVVGTTNEPALLEGLGLDRSSYEGPTGIVGVLHDTARKAGLPSASLWAAVPTYVPGAPSPKAALALVDRLADLLSVSIPRHELHEAVGRYEQRIDELIAEDDDLLEYVQALEADRSDADPMLPSGNELIDDIERFLRDRGA